MTTVTIRIRENEEDTNSETEAGGHDDEPSDPIGRSVRHQTHTYQRHDRQNGREDDDAIIGSRVTNRLQSSSRQKGTSFGC